MNTMSENSSTRKINIHPAIVSALIVVILIASIAAFIFLSARPTCCTETLSDEQIASISNDAKKGDVAAMKRLFFFFEERSMNGDAEKSAYWLKHAADAGDGQAKVFMYEKLDTLKDPEAQRQAMKYLTDAANQGDQTAKEILDNLHRDASPLPHSANK